VNSTVAELQAQRLDLTAKSILNGMKGGMRALFTRGCHGDVSEKGGREKGKKLWKIL